MFEKLSILKGLHPGFFLEYELKKKKLSKRQFAISIAEHPQTIGAITNGKRDVNTPLSLKAEQALGLEEGFLMMLQTFYDIKLEKEKNRDKGKPNLDLIRPMLFWDVKFEKIDWDQHKEFIIERIFKRGNKEEQKEIQKFYGKHVVSTILSKLPANNYIKIENLVGN